MREEPNLTGAEIEQFLSVHYGLRAAEITFLPRGGDPRAAAYRVTSGEGAQYFLKCSAGDVNAAALEAQRFLSGSGIAEIISPFAARDGQLWARLGSFYAVLYPYIEGRSAFDIPLAAGQWAEFGAAIRAVHDILLPVELRTHVARETFSPLWCERARMVLSRAEGGNFPDSLATRYAEFLRMRTGEILHIIHMVERLATVLEEQPPGYVLCHSDLHAGNLLIDASRRLYIVDWDAPVLAPKERDLMFIGGGVGSAWYSAEEEALFYRGYGPAEIDPAALAYYRFARIAQDIAEWGELMLLTGSGGADRARAVGGLRRWFEPNDVVEMAYKAEQALPSALRSG